jgi:hypothetical protein
VKSLLFMGGLLLRIGKLILIHERDPL